MAEKYQVVVWDNEASAPFNVLIYKNKEIAQQVARNMKAHYVDVVPASFYEVYLQRIEMEGNDD